MGSPAPVVPGDILLNKYRVEGILGQGGMGTVIAARHIELDELFAIKVMLPGIAENAEAVERFLREARAAAKLKGEHVAKVQDVGRLPDGTPYMVLEYLTGSDLKKLVRAGGPLPVGEAVAYVTQACETLREAHTLGIVHRDVKPANIFLTHRPNGTPCVKVLDFGISKQTMGDAVGLTSTGSVGGSPLYMSPEQMRSAKHVDLRTDIWSIGIVLYELLTGITPFHAETITAVAGRVLQDDPVPPSQVQAGIPASVDALVLRCLAKRPDGRFQSMDELMAALRVSLQQAAGLYGGAIEDATLPISRVSLVSISNDFAPPPVYRSDPGLAPAFTGVPLPASTTTAGFAKTSGATFPSVAAQPPPRKINGIIAVALVVATAGLAAAAAAALWFRAGEEPALAGAPNAAAAEPIALTAMPGSPTPSATPITVEPGPAVPAIATVTTAAPSGEPVPPAAASVTAIPSAAPVAALPSSAPKPGVTGTPAVKSPSKPLVPPATSTPAKKPRILF